MTFLMSEHDLPRRRVLTRAAGLAGLGLVASALGCASTSSRPSLVGTPLPDDPEPIRPRLSPRPRVVPASTSLAIATESRSVWAKFGPNYKAADPMGRVQRITVHHDAIPSHMNMSRIESTRRLESIRRGHVAQGWADIGYHYAIDPSGRIWEGRPITLQGAHVRDQNPSNIGIMVMGNFQRERPTPAAAESLRRLLAAECARNGLTARDVHTHRELASTACPGNNLQAVMNSLRDNPERLRRI
jgi:hypothetical protein